MLSGEIKKILIDLLNGELLSAVNDSHSVADARVSL
jgi:hypothetical protein